MLILPLPIILLGLVGLYFASINIYLQNYGISAEAEIISVKSSGKGSGGSFTYQYTTPESEVIRKRDSVSSFFYSENMGARTIQIKHGKIFSDYSIIEGGFGNISVFFISLFGLVFTSFGSYMLWHSVRIFRKLNS